MNSAQIYHEVSVTAETASGDETLDGRYHLHIPLEGDSAVVIGERNRLSFVWFTRSCSFYHVAIAWGWLGYHQVSGDDLFQGIAAPSILPLFELGSSHVQSGPKIATVCSCTLVGGRETNLAKIYSLR